MKLSPVNLVGHKVKLIPIEEKHLNGLAECVRDGDLWRLHVTTAPNPKHLDHFYKQARRSDSTGSSLTYTIVSNKSQEVIGSTRLFNYNDCDKKVEIGHTFLAKSSQKTGVNTECKYLLLEHAFETIKLNRVEFLTDYLNFNSRRAILRIGAKEEGILRNHKVMPDGRVRDSVIYSVIRNEWNGIKIHLKSLMTEQGSGGNG